MSKTPVSEIRTIQWHGDHVTMIDQRKLPHEEVYLDFFTFEEIATAIREMVIRGAPAIGVAAAMGVALGIGKKQGEFKKIKETLFQSRPTAVNLKWALDRMERCYEKGGDLEQEALKIYEEDIRTNIQMADHGKKLICDGMAVLTICNTGTLATAGYGTALGVIRRAFEGGKKVHVFVSETRPFLQGLRLTSWELHKLGIPQTVISDNMAGALMAQGKIQAVFTGADRIARNGDTANKIGTYSLAVLSHFHQIPFYVVAPTSTIDLKCLWGKEIPIEERNPREVTHIQGKAIGLEGVAVYNPSFDVTPHHLITALVTEKGVAEPVNQASLERMMSRH